MKGGPQPGSGRPTKLTAEVVRQICSSVAVGNSFADACALIGIEPETRRNWLKRGAEERERKVRRPGAKPSRVKVVLIFGKYTEQTPDGPVEVEGVIGWRSGKFRAFSEAFERAMATFRESCVGNVRVAGVDQWQAAAWLLERKFPQRFAKTERHEMTGAKGGPVKVESALTIYMPAEKAP